MKKIRNNFVPVLVLSYFIILLFSACKASDNENPFKDSTIKKQMKAAFKWQEKNPIYAKAPTDWTNGAYYTGVVTAYKATKDKAYLKGLIDMGKRNQWQPWERFYHADDLAICYSYIYLASIGREEVNMAPTDTIIEQHTFKPYPWRDHIPGKIQQALWWWCDALFMAPPVYTEYAKYKKDTIWLNYMDQFYHQTYSLLYDHDEHLFARDLRFVWKNSPKDMKEPNGKKIFWSRGNGWVLAGLALILDDMPKNYSNRAFYVNLYKEMAARIAKLQPEDGLWRTSLLDPETYDHGEESGSGFFTFALAWGINNGLLDKEKYTPVVKKAWLTLIKCQHDNGMIGWVQNIGFDPKPADFDSYQNFGTGAFLLAGSEILKIYQ